MVKDQPMFSSGQVNRLPVQIAIIVPSTRGDHEISDSAFKKRVEKTRKKMDSLWGGDTTVRASGGWLSGQGQLVTEKTAKVESSTTHDEWNKKKDKLKRWIKKKRKNWKQTQIAYEFEGTLYAYPEKDWMPDEPR